MSDSITPDEYTELRRLLVQLLRRIEHLEKFTGAVKEDPIPCCYCGMKYSHHPWCETRKADYVKRA